MFLSEDSTVCHCEHFYFKLTCYQREMYSAIVLPHDGPQPHSPFPRPWPSPLASNSEGDQQRGRPRCGKRAERYQVCGGRLETDQTVKNSLLFYREANASSKSVTSTVSDSSPLNEANLWLLCSTLCRTSFTKLTCDCCAQLPAGQVSRSQPVIAVLNFQLGKFQVNL